MSLRCLWVRLFKLIPPFFLQCATRVFANGMHTTWAARNFTINPPPLIPKTISHLQASGPRRYRAPSPSRRRKKGPNILFPSLALRVWPNAQGMDWCFLGANWPGMGKNCDYPKDQRHPQMTQMRRVNGPSQTVLGSARKFSLPCSTELTNFAIILLNWHKIKNFKEIL